MAGLLDAILGMSGQERTEALRQLGRDLEYYVPPELRGILGFAAEMTPSETLSRAGASGREMLAPERTAMERLGSAGQMLSETAGVAAPMMVAGRAAMPAAQALQEGLLGFSVAADDVGRRVVDRLNQPGPVPTMYSNPVGRAAGDGIEATLRAKYPDAKIYISGDASRGYTLSQIELPKNMRNSGVGSNIMQDFVSMADAQGAKINLTPSKAFGGSVARLKDFYKRFGFVENKGKNKDFSTRETMYREPSAPTLPAPRNEAEAMAKRVLEMRAAGRAGDVTEEMMAATDPQYMFANTPLPMDEASRMARARELGFDLGGLLTHGSKRDIYGFSLDAPKSTDFGWYGQGISLAPNDPRISDAYAMVEKEGVGQWAGRTYPVTSKGRTYEWPASNPPATSLEQSKEITQSLRDLGYERANIYAPDDPDVWGPAAGSWREQVVYDPRNIRSRFARFDPAFAHLRNLSAGVGGLGILSLLAQQEQEREQEIRQYLGGLL